MKYINKILLCACFFMATTSFASTPKDTSVKFAFLSPNYQSPSTSATFNGARDAAKALRGRFGKDMSVDFISAENSAQKQLKQLSNLYLDGYKGAIVYPVEGNANEISAAAQTLAERGFYVSIVGTQVNAEHLAACVSTDTKKTAEMLSKQIEKFSEGKKISILCYFYDQGERKSLDFTDKDLIAKYIYPNLTFKEFSNIFEPLAPSKMIAMQYYWQYAKQNALEIQRYDNFGEIFFSPRLLEDVSPIKKDIDRRFAIVIGALPQFAFYLSAGAINACIYDDFYGWGYIAARALMEKSFDSQNGEVGTQFKLLSPLLATPNSVKDFVSDWRKWLK